MDMSRRELLSGGLAAATVALTGPPATAHGPEPGLCLNTATVRAAKLPLDELVLLAADAGYNALEPWLAELRQYRDAGGSLPDLKARLADRGIHVPSAIGFARWRVDDEAERAQGLAQMREDMELVAAIGGTAIAAPPAGVNNAAPIPLAAMAERYRAVLDLGRQTGVVPQLEIWGMSRNLSRLSDAAAVALEAADPDACLLLDVFHLHRGGSGLASLRLLNGAAMRVFHVNDYPADPPADQLKDSDRVYPGDGAAPLEQLLADLRAIFFTGWFSVELFNPAYAKLPADQVARTARDKMAALLPPM